MIAERQTQRALVAESSLAPSVHNVQPARWRIGEDEVTLLEDTRRRLPVADPAKITLEMVEALKQAGNEPRFTIYPEAGHDSWTSTYDNPELFAWFLSNRRSAARTR